jgi:hypothetical protein
MVGALWSEIGKYDSLLRIFNPEMTKAGNSAESSRRVVPGVRTTQEVGFLASCAVVSIFEISCLPRTVRRTLVRNSIRNVQLGAFLNGYRKSSESFNDPILLSPRSANH